MIEIFLPFVNQLLSYCGFKPSQLPAKYYRDLVTAFCDLPNQQVILIPSLVALAQACPGRLIIDDTGNPKYGLKPFLQSLKNHATGQYFKGYRVLMFLWKAGNLRIPIGFALCHAQSLKPQELSLKGLSILRNHYHLKPLMVLGDAAFSTDEITKRLDDYGWGFVFRSKKNRKISGKQSQHLIARGYGEYCGLLENGVKLKLVRRKRFWVICNRLSLKGQKILEIYRNRWGIEEVFRFLKSCIGLNRCHQHSMKAQAIYLILCLLLASCFELHSEHCGYSNYYLYRQVILGQLPIENILKPKLFDLS